MVFSNAVGTFQVFMLPTIRFCFSHKLQNTVSQLLKFMSQMAKNADMISPHNSECTSCSVGSLFNSCTVSRVKEIPQGFNFCGLYSENKRDIWHFSKHKNCNICFFQQPPTTHSLEQPSQLSGCHFSSPRSVSTLTSFKDIDDLLRHWPSSLSFCPGCLWLLSVFRWERQLLLRLYL